MICVFERFVQIIELRESFLNIPFILVNLELNIKVDGTRICFVFLVGWDCDTDGWNKIIVAHNRYYCKIYIIYKYDKN